MYIWLALLLRSWICPGYLHGQSCVWDLLRCIRASSFTPGNIRLTDLRLLNVRAARFRSRSYGLIDLWLLLNIRAAPFTPGNVRLANLRLLNVRAAGFGSRDLSLANGWLRLG